MARPRGCSRPPGHAATGDEADEAGANLGRLAQRRDGVRRSLAGRGSRCSFSGEPEKPRLGLLVDRGSGAAEPSLSTCSGFWSREGQNCSCYAIYAHAIGIHASCF